MFLKTATFDIMYSILRFELLSYVSHYGLNYGMCRDPRVKSSWILITCLTTHFRGPNSFQTTASQETSQVIIGSLTSFHILNKHHGSAYA